jgi:predicted ribosome quality control (RQC) complex YloA/Tae2 family protein
VLEVYTYEKNELCFAFNKTTVFIGQKHPYSYIYWRDDFIPPKKKVTLFEHLINQKLNSINIINNKRVIELIFSDFSVYINLYFSSIGFILTRATEIVQSVKSANFDRKTEHIDTSKQIHRLLNTEATIRSTTSDQIISEINKSDSIYLYSNGVKEHLSLIPLKSLTADFVLEKKADDFFTNYSPIVNFILSQHEFRETKLVLKDAIFNSEKIVKATLKNIESVYLNKNESTNFEILGHLIISNQHLIMPYDKSVKLTNWFLDPPSEVVIPLKEKLTAQENAEHYYKRAKAQVENQKKLNYRLQANQEKLILIKKWQEKLEKAKRFKELEQLKKELIEKRIMQEPSTNKHEISLPQNYHEFSIDSLVVYIGKDAKTNDFLSLKKAHANDLWFHVQGSAGSHVVLVCHHLKQDPNKETIKKVAALCAFYSKQKTGGNVPVIYTKAKYVRKPRGAAAGAVTVSQEKSVFVNPTPIEEL